MTERLSLAWQQPVLGSAAAASADCRSVVIDTTAVEAVADWMQFEVFAPVDGNSPDDPERPGLETWAEQVDFTLVTVAINFAYTDFVTREPWSITVDGHELVDADAMFYCFEKAYAAGVPVLTGEWLAGLDEAKLGEVLTGPWQIPLLAERAEVLRGLGEVLVEKYQGHFHHFVSDCAPAVFADGNGLLERLLAEFPHFRDSSTLHGHEVHFDKLAQLGIWTLHRLGLVQLQDLDSLAVFADYIVPAGLRAMRILNYSPELAAAVDGGEVIPAGSEWENEIRVQTVMACGLLTDALSARRGAPLVNPQVDYRFWSAFHDLIRPHHLTITTRY